ncbi:MAG: polyribonucleotide nucleotidyltransferase, partial [Rickettsiales bacterium]|jgi:polyribonucleotide nucleotidyltransferase|nr:polyribonucleotide nucleotidyltransferase [Rickettsiales bacterium]
MGETVVLATVVANKESKPDQDFFPLSVHYQEKFSAAGKIPGGFMKREAKPSTRETLISRLIDRPIRPLFPETFNNEVQIVATTYSYDKAFSPDIVAMIACSAALAISGIPFNGPIAGARVGFKDGKYLLNPSETSDLELVVAGTKEGVLMVESEAKELTEEEMLKAVEFGFDNFQSVIKGIEEFKKAATKEAWNIPELTPEQKEVQKLFEKELTSDFKAAFAIKEKLTRQDAVASVREKGVKILTEKFGNDEDKEKLSTTLRAAKNVFHEMESNIVRTAILDGEKRIDGRKTDEIRPITCEVGILPRCHGSALFTRGETQALVMTTLGNSDEGQSTDDITGLGIERFMLHYNFPPFSVGETGRMGAPGRREIGHGKLAWRANNPMLPTEEEFPYAIRIISEVTESNGSSSMATTCGASLAMMDAGVPVKAPVAGIAMGLIKEGKKYEILSDIMGDEDHLGDMDFKVAGTKDGITSLQMDLKITSITFDIMKKALAQAKDGRIHILKKMSEAIKSPRKEMSKYAPQIDTSITIKVDQIKTLIGSGGANIKELVARTNTKIDIKQNGNISICGAVDDIENAKQEIKALFAEPEIGEIYTGEVVANKDFGSFISLTSSIDGLLHISEISRVAGKKIAHPDDIFAVGDKVVVEITGIDKKGKIQLVWKK